LNEETAERYVNWIEKQLQSGKELKLHIYSEYEYELVSKAMKKHNMPLN
jgi:predicted deacetylase